MFEQETMFPKTELDEAHAVLSKLLADQEKAENAVDNAEKKQSEIMSLVYKQRHVIKRLQSMMPPVDGGVGAEPVEEVEVIDEGVPERREPLAIEGDVLDPITGEVVSKAAREDEDDDENPCPVGDPDCEGDEESCHDACEAPYVRVVWPDGQPFSAPIGEHTTYGELVADYLADSLIDLEPEDFNVVSEHGSVRPLNKAIVPPDYGREFRIQEKATEAELAEHEALKAQEPAA